MAVSSGQWWNVLHGHSLSQSAHGGRPAATFPKITSILRLIANMSEVRLEQLDLLQLEVANGQVLLEARVLQRAVAGTTEMRRV